LAKILSFAALLCSAGCGFSSVDVLHPGDLAGVSPGQPDLAGVDFAGVDFAGVDQATPPGNNDMSGGCNACNCGQPVLLVAVESFSSSSGRVLQLGLGSGGTPTSCKDLTAAGTLSKSPNSIGWFPPDSVIFGAPDGIVLVDAVKDLQRWTYHTTVDFPPFSVFPLQNGATSVVAVGFDTTGFNDIVEVHILDAKNGTKTVVWDVTDANGPLHLGSEVPAMVQSPLDPSHIFFVSNGASTAEDFPAGDVAAPFDGNPVTPTVYFANRPTGNHLSTINVVRNAPGGLKRTVWLQHGNVSLGADAVFYANDDGSGPTFTGPLRCNLAQCSTPFTATDAVPDPTSANAVFATCNSADDNVKHVVRFDDGGNCTLIVDGTKLAANTNPLALAIAEAQ
jgi:hypothetical protein